MPTQIFVPLVIHKQEFPILMGFESASKIAIIATLHGGTDVISYVA
jgi:hypothetical protein